MFAKQNAHFAYAAAGAPSSERTSNPTRSSSMMFAGSEAEDVNAFGFGTAPRREQPSRNVPPRRRPPKRNNRPMMLGIAAVAAIAVLLILIIAIAVSADKSIEKEDHSYIVYSVGGSYSVASDGKVINNSFEGEVELYTAADNSFAYVTESTADGYRVFLLEGKKLELLTTSAVNEVLVYADYAPGIVYETDDGKINIFTEKYGEDRITADGTASNFLISGDASTVIYTVEDDNNANKKNLYLYRNGDDNEKISSWVTPRGLSMDGRYVYVSAPDSKVLNERLFYIDTDEEEFERVPMSVEGNFSRILATNLSGKEVLFFTLDGTDAITYLYSMNRKGMDDDANPSVKVGKGIYVPFDNNGTVACFESFKKCYLEGTKSLELSLNGLSIDGATYYIEKDYTTVKVADALGRFSDDGDYFYYIGDGDDLGTLYQINLKKDNLERTKIGEDVAEFALTAKGNLYILNDENKLSFRKLSAAKNTTISLDVEEISMLESGNTLYFTEEESDIVYSTKEGSEKKIVKFDSVQITQLPVFVDESAEKVYAFVNDDAMGYCLYYSHNARSFKTIATDCDEPELGDWLEKLLEDILGY